MTPRALPRADSGGASSPYGPAAPTPLADRVTSACSSPTAPDAEAPGAVGREDGPLSARGRARGVIVKPLHMSGCRRAWP